MFKYVISENLDFVFGSRYQKNASSDDDTIITLIGNYIFTALGKIFFGLKITDILYSEADDVIFYKGVILFNKEEYSSVIRQALAFVVFK